MTREEQIENAAVENGCGFCDNGYARFAEGAAWADEHPRWISVEDELPKPGERVVVLQDAYGNFSYTACYFQSANQHSKMVDFHVKSDAYIGISKNAEVTLGSITHWMPLPAPPVSKIETTTKTKKQEL